MKTLTEQRIKEIRKKPNDQDWWDISTHRKLSEPFIREFQDKVYWRYISMYQTLSEDFIYEFLNKINCFYISIYQTHLSIETRNKIKVIYKLSK